MAVMPGPEALFASGPPTQPQSTCNVASAITALPLINPTSDLIEVISTDNMISRLQRDGWRTVHHSRLGTHKGDHHSPSGAASRSESACFPETRSRLPFPETAAWRWGNGKGRPARTAAPGGVPCAPHPLTRPRPSNPRSASRRRCPARGDGASGPGRPCSSR